MTNDSVTHRLKHAGVAIVALAATYVPAAMADPYFAVDVGTTLIVDNSDYDRDPNTGSIVFAVHGAKRNQALFDVTGTATLSQTGYGVEMALSDLDLYVTRLDPVRTDFYILFTASGFSLPLGRYRTQLALGTAAPQTNDEDVFSRIRSDLEPGGFGMGELGALLQPGGIVDRLGIPRISPVEVPTILHGNWGIQDVHEVGTGIFVSNAIARIHYVPEPHPMWLILGALGVLGLLQTQWSGRSQLLSRAGRIEGSAVIARPVRANSPWNQSKRSCMEVHRGAKAERPTVGGWALGRGA